MALLENSEVPTAIAESYPTATLNEIQTDLLKRRTGIDAHEQTIVSTLRKLGVKRVPSHEAVVVEQAAEGSRRYGDTGARRRPEPEQATPVACQTPNGSLVSDPFENLGGRGRLPQESRRTLVDHRQPDLFSVQADARGFVVLAIRRLSAAPARSGRGAQSARISMRRARTCSAFGSSTRSTPLV